ncbi:MAG TPA: hypothetical protein VN851_13060 [Thermoanaerobaculia bacterium]|nr:hypothetical protein [Thermoanaerobaculia bacterium]
MSIFDAYLMVDWSASTIQGSGENSIWAAWGLGDEALPTKTANLPSRERAQEVAKDLLAEAVNRKLRVLVGFDFAYGYPKGFGAAMGLPGTKPAWRAIWDRISLEMVTAKLDRFSAATELNRQIGDPARPGPFWARPKLRVEPEIDFLPCKKENWQSSKDRTYQTRSGHTLSTLRKTDEFLPGTQEVWKLFAPGAVGGQSLTGIPTVLSLFETFEKYSAVWPFETGLMTPTRPKGEAFILHAEVWPGILEQRTDRLDHETFACRDEAQVYCLVEVLRRLDLKGDLHRLFAPECIPGSFDPSFVLEEGWTLGAGIDSDLAAEIRRRTKKAILDRPKHSW